MDGRRWARRALAALAVVIAGCSSATADVSENELRTVIERDGIAFEDATIPAVVVERLAGNKVVVLGETHHLREHWALVAALMSDLHADGFRQLLIEAPQMASWLLDDYVQGSPLMPGWEAPPFYQRRLSAIRELNDGLPAGDRIHVRGIDANEAWYGGGRDFHLLLGWFVDALPTPGPTGPFLASDYGNADASSQRAAIEELLARVQADRSALTDAWGVDSYELLVDLLETERTSIDVRDTREHDDDAGARMREDLIKRMVEGAIDDCGCGTVINIGGHHAQKSHLMGTDQEWMGDYLAHTSPVVNGSVIVIGLASATTELEPGAEGTPWDILESASPDNELLRVMAQTFPDRTVFLPLDDPLFADRTVAYNSEDVIYITALEEQFDAIIQYGHASRMPVN